MERREHIVGVRELRQNLSVYLRRVEAGETLQVTEHGRPVALLTPPQPALNVRDRLIAAGKLIPATRGHDELPDATHYPTRMSSLAALDLEREERLP